MSKKTRKKSGKPEAMPRAAGSATSRKSKAKSGMTGNAAKKAAKKSSKKAVKSAKRAPFNTASKSGTAKKPPASNHAAKTGRAAVAPVRKISALAERDAAPAFSLPRDGGQRVALADFAGRKLAIFFYPRADTPGCTREAMDFSRLSSAYAASKTVVLGVSADPVKAQESFRNKHQLGIPLLSDEKHDTLMAYGAWGEKSMYGRTCMGIPRTTVLIDARGKIARIWRNVKVDGHAEEVLAAASAL